MRASVILPAAAVLLLAGSMMPAHVERAAGCFLLGLWIGNVLWSAVCRRKNFKYG